MARSLEMNFIKEIISLNEKLSLSQKETAKAVGKSRDTVSNVLKMAKALDITYSKAIEMKDDELKNLIYPNSNPYRDIPEPDMEWIDHEMKTHKNMTMMILHQEYLEKYPDGLKYTLIPISKFFSYQIS
jgi:transcriptional regulator with XRE-family HTH domain